MHVALSLYVCSSSFSRCFGFLDVIESSSDIFTSTSIEQAIKAGIVPKDFLRKVHLYFICHGLVESITGTLNVLIKYTNVIVQTHIYTNNMSAIALSPSTTYIICVTMSLQTERDRGREGCNALSSKYLGRVSTNS